VKVKYTAAIALVAWFGVVGWVTSMVVAKPVVLPYRNDNDTSSTMAQFQLDIARNAKAMAGLQALKNQAYAGTTNEPLLAVAPPAPPGGALGEPGAGGTVQPGQPGYEHIVSMVVSVPGSRRAVVDGSYVAVGGRLPGGVRVRAIGADWVDIEDVSGQRRLHVRQAFSAGNGAGAPR
jgi:hypothetical protein